MDQAKKQRKVLRSRLTKSVNEIKDLLTRNPVEWTVVEVKLSMAEQTSDAVEEISNQIIDLLYQEDATEEDIEAEMDGNQGYKESFLLIKKEVEVKQPGSEPSEAGYSTAVSGAAASDTKKGYHLPKMKLKEFSGEFLDWLGWWAQFEPIHKDPTIDVAVKIQFLEMCMVKGSRAKTAIGIVNHTQESYDKAVETLKHRFGREEIQVEVYVRELLRLVINNISNKEKLSLPRLYDQLEAHLRALESLGVSSEKYDAMLGPLVESCLPETTLKAWQRSPLFKMDGSKENPPRTKLQFLLEFVRSEVEGEERMVLAREAFGMRESKSEPHNKQDKFAGKMRKSEGRPPTAIGLVNEAKSSDCVFCAGKHATEACGQARKMTFQEKREKLRKGRRCFICLQAGCMARDCKAQVICVVCGGRHHTLMCSSLSSGTEQDKKSSPEILEKDNGNTSKVVASTANLGATSGEVYLLTTMVELVNGNKRKKVRTLIDSASQRSHIKSSTAEEMGYVKTGTETLIHGLFGGSRSSEVVHNKFAIEVKTKDSSFKMGLNVLDSQTICHRIASVPKGKWMAQLQQNKIWLEDFDNGDKEVELMIGADYDGRIRKSTVQLSCGLTAVETSIGWMVMGQFADTAEASREVRTSHSMMCTSMAVTQMSVPDLWRLETIGITDPIEVESQAEEEAEVLRQFEETIQQGPEGRYIVKLPWRRDVPDLPTNRAIAEKRLQSTTKKLRGSSSIVQPSANVLSVVPESASLPRASVDWDRAGTGKDAFGAYDQVFREWLEEGIIEEIREDKSEKCHYLPHRAVIKVESATTKVRPVFDASCKSGRAPSLNDCLEKGPNMIDLIPAVMTRFREGKIGIIADIRKAFLMIEVAKEDRDFLRFLWWEGPDCKKVKVFRHKRVVFGVNSSPFLLAAVLRHHLMKYESNEKDVAMKLLHSFYVDNCVASVDSKEELIRFVEVSTVIMKEAGMDLRLWQHSLDATEDMDERIVPVLGMKWDRFRDVLFCDSPAVTIDPEKVTKREMLSLTQTIFDPLGIVAPVTVQPKLLLQEAWAQKKGWDDPVEDEAKMKFLRWTEGLSGLSHIQVPRVLNRGNEDRSKWSIHCFTDASSYAYATVVFLRCGGEQVSVQLLYAKARVAPIKTATIPRLELLGCLIGARLTTAAVCASWNLEGIPVRYWSDSSTALAWIRRNDDWGTFVGNRVREILRLSEAKQWSHVPGKVNPADLPSRGCLPKDVLESRWWEGPDWLKWDVSSWPKEVSFEDEAEIAMERLKSVASNVATMEKPEVQWYLRGSSGYNTMLRRASYAFRFVDRVRKRETYGGSISATELRATERRLVRVVQEEVFGDVKSFRRLGVFRDQQGIFRLETKLLLRQDRMDFKTPMLLPTKHPFVTELIRELHLIYCHGGPQVLISVLREKFWIIQTRRAVSKVIYDCQRCKRFAAKNVEVEAAPLPENRVRDAAPFEIIGVDLAGPLFLRDKKKAWIVLFTCAVYRGVHLELVTSLDTDHFLQAFRRLIARRGRPSVVYSDNGTNFRGAVNLFAKVDWEKIRRQCEVIQIDWKFSPPTASWWGGFWERLVKSVKDLLVRVLGRSSVFYEELMTILCDVESVINQRPLTVMTEDDNDLVALTPAIFLQGVRESGVPDMDIIDMEGMKKRFQYRQQLMEELRRRFRKEYLANLIQRAKERTNFEVRVGDLVLVGEDGKKRLGWQLGKVTEVFRRLGDRSGPVRVAKMKTPGGDITRPVRRLYPMELNPEDEIEETADAVFTRRGRLVRKPKRFQ